MLREFVENTLFVIALLIVVLPEGLPLTVAICVLKLIDSSQRELDKTKTYLRLQTLSSHLDGDEEETGFKPLKRISILSPLKKKRTQRISKMVARKIAL